MPRRGDKSMNQHVIACRAQPSTPEGPCARPHHLSDADKWRGDRGVGIESFDSVRR